MQRKLHSLIEALTNVAIGYSIALVTQIVVFPMFGIYIPFADNLQICAVFTCISIIRQYVVRRFFNHKTAKMILK
ncbi:MAG: hypothetical protein R8M45_03780 [Ghiorsea sp.]